MSDSKDSTPPKDEPTPEERLYSDVEQLKEEQASLRRDARISAERVLQGIHELGETVDELSTTVGDLSSTVVE